MQFTAIEDNSTSDLRTIHVANLVPEKITEALLYELFLQVSYQKNYTENVLQLICRVGRNSFESFLQRIVQGGPLERVSIPKEKDGSNRAYGFITYRHFGSVAYALSVFSGTRLHNRELRLNYRQANRNNADNSTNAAGSSNLADTRSQAMCPQPLMSMMPPLHQFQMQNSFDNSALNARGASALSSPVQMNIGNPFSNSMTPRKGKSTSGGQPSPLNQTIDVNQLLELSAQMLPPMAGQGTDMHNHQSKMMHRDDNRAHGRNNNYSRDREQRREDRKRDRSRERSDWVRNQCQNYGAERNDNNDRNQRHGRNNRNGGGNRNSDNNNRFRSDDRRRF